MLPQPKSNVLNTLPHNQSTEEAWNQAGPEFRQGQTRFRTYGNTFDAGVVLPDCLGPRPFCAHMHATTNINKPPDISVDDNDIIPLRTVAHASASLADSTGIDCHSSESFPSTRMDAFSPHQKSAHFIKLLARSKISDMVKRFIKPINVQKSTQKKHSRRQKKAIASQSKKHFIFPLLRIGYSDRDRDTIVFFLIVQ